jgi:hypothetical protein
MNNELTYHEGCRNEAIFPVLCGNTSSQTRTRTLGAYLGLILVAIVVIIAIKNLKKH